MAQIEKCIDSRPTNHVSFRKNIILVMVGQKELMPGQIPGYARVWLCLCLAGPYWDSVL